MKKIEELVRQFIEDEYNCNVAKSDYTVTNEEYENLKEKVYTYFHSVMYIGYGRGKAIEKTDELSIKLNKKNVDDARKRVLFQIKKFENPVLGGTLKRYVKNKTIYKADLSFREITPSEFLQFDIAYYIAETDEGLKIVYLKRYDFKIGIWEHQHAGDYLQVLEDGTLVDVLKLQTPVQANSLKEYNGN